MKNCMPRPRICFALQTLMLLLLRVLLELMLLLLLLLEVEP